MDRARIDPWYALTWVEWLGVIGVVLTLVGLYLTWRQATDAASKAEEVRSAILTTEETLRTQQLLFLIPQLQWISSELDAAINDDERILARKILENWSRTAGSVAGILDAHGFVPGDLSESIQHSLGTAHIARTGLLTGKKTVADSCKYARESIATVCNSVTVWSSRQSLSASAPGGRHD